MRGELWEFVLEGDWRLISGLQNQWGTWEVLDEVVLRTRVTFPYFVKLENRVLPTTSTMGHNIHQGKSIDLTETVSQVTFFKHREHEENKNNPCKIGYV